MQVPQEWLVATRRQARDQLAASRDQIRHPNLVLWFPQFPLCVCVHVCVVHVLVPQALKHFYTQIKQVTVF